MSNVGIFAYGSLIDDPGDEIAVCKTGVIENAETPFPVEFARSSNSRGGAPTLVPVTTGGAKVKGQIILVGASAEDATHMLYRREIHTSDRTKRYKPPPENATGRVRVRALQGCGGVESVLYTDIDSNIDDLTPERMAIASVGAAKRGEDGISYLINARKYGIETALSGAYAAERGRPAKPLRSTPDSSEPRLLDVREAARRLGLSKSTLEM
jgi:hypothetical protein